VIWRVNQFLIDLSGPGFSPILRYITTSFVVLPFGQLVGKVHIMIYLTRVEHFNAAHKLYNPAWSRERNEAVFGKCANENWHGHNFELHITVKGQPDPETGFIFDAKKLSALVNRHVIEKLDHRNLNLDVDFMQGKMCSIENLVTAIWHQIVPHLPPNVMLHKLRLVETPRIFVEYFGE